MEINESTMKFRAPRDTEWRALSNVLQPEGVEPEDAQEAVKQVRSNRDELKNVLLTSLQMQHLVVLAGSGCSFAAGGPSMGDLWDEAVGDTPNPAVQRVAKTVGHPLSDTNIEAFLSRIEALLYVRKDNRAEKLLKQCKEIILRRCSGFLDIGKLEAHTTFLHRLSRRRLRDRRMKLFTTNYDLCFERAAGRLGAVALDGFSFGAPRRYDSRFYGYDIVRRGQSIDDRESYLEGVFLLFKLHGSVNWARLETGEIVEKATPTAEEACLIYPAAGKYQSSYRQPHLESMAQFLGALREPNTCVVIVGFGFNDDHLSEPILAAAGSNPHLRLIVVDPKASEKVNASDSSWTRLSQMSASGEDVFFVEASFEGFANLIPDLKSLTPADSLMKAIKGAAGS